jgi:hypothetical protein
MHHLVGGDPEHLIAGAFKLGLSFDVILKLQLVNRSVHLDDQSRARAEKVHDVRPDRMLATKPIELKPAPT